MAGLDKVAPAVMLSPTKMMSYTGDKGGRTLAASVGVMICTSSTNDERSACE